MKKINKLFLHIVWVSISIQGSIRPPILKSPLEINPRKKNESFIQNIEKTKKKTIPTSWGGSELTQEEKEENGIKVTTYSLKGGAWILHDKVKLSSLSIEIIGEDAVHGFLKGGVKVEDTESKSVLYAGKGVYDKYGEIVTLDERPQILTRGKNKEVTKVTSPYIRRYLADSRSAMEKGVILENKEYTILGESAVMYEKEDRVVMDDYPYIFGKNKFMSATKMYYDSEKKDIVLENEAMIVQSSMEKKKKKPKEDKEENVENNSTSSKDTKNSSTENSEEEDATVKVTSIFIGDKIISHSGSDLERYTGMFGNAKFIRPDNEFQAAYIKAFGKDNEKVEARDGVTMTDFENNVRLSGNLLEYDKPSDYAHVTEDAKIEFLSKETQDVNSTLTAVEIEKFSDKKEIVARGEVTITTEDSISKGEFATYFEEEEKIYLEGNPTLTRGGKTIQCGKIVVYPNENKVYISEVVNTAPGKEKFREFSP
ncbi:MAG: hypothetical protein L6Q54_00960 [Leptospiraceae bacterium]|nr:hypothetical protein [Leptospiraceae bacterium]MCK6379808.1 hypothetical protein [Leptospiraceae bacterium]NUM41539.1 hypothetical protein [Leptospiraceae bacterium]